MAHAARAHPRTAEYIAGVYHFDEVRTGPVGVRIRGSAWEVAAGPLELCFRVGRQGPLGLALRAVPGRSPDGRCGRP